MYTYVALHMMCGIELTPLRVRHQANIPEWQIAKVPHKPIVSFFRMCGAMKAAPRCVTPRN